MNKIHKWSFVAALAGFLFGFDTIVISGSDQLNAAFMSQISDMNGEKNNSALSRRNGNPKYQTCWKGKLNSKINVMLSYQLKDELIFGQLIYLDTKEKKPIRIIGTIQDNNTYRLEEFNKEGNITGIIIGSPGNKIFTGTWYSPNSSKEFGMRLMTDTTKVQAENIESNLSKIEGEYRYQYGEKGYEGSVVIDQVNSNEMAFEIFSVSKAPLRSIASVERDTIKRSNNFIYKIPSTDSCEISVRVFKEFTYIKYVRGYCTGVFGLNATVDGIFYKIK